MTYFLLPDSDTEWVDSEHPERGTFFGRPGMTEEEVVTEWNDVFALSSTIADPPLDLARIAAARLTVDGWDVTGLERSVGLSLAFVADTDTVWVFFDESQPDTEYIVVPPEGVTKYDDHIEITKPGLAAVSLIVQRVQ